MKSKHLIKIDNRIINLHDFIVAKLSDDEQTLDIELLAYPDMTIESNHAKKFFDYLTSLCIATFDDSDEIPPQSADFIDPSWTKRTIIGIEHKASNSGNPTWYCDVEGESKKLYIRQSNKDIWIEHYPDLEKMNLGDTAEKVDITCYTIPDGDFMKPVKVIAGGVFTLPDISASAQRKAQVVESLKDYQEWVFGDFESTGVNDDDEIVQVGLMLPNGDLIDFLVKPNDPQKLLRVGKKGKTASEINGIIPEDLTNAKTFPEVYAQIREAIQNKPFATYSDYDLKTLNQVCAMHNLPQIVPSEHINLMPIIAKYIGEPNKFKSGEYKWQPLTDAYETITGNKDFEDAHNAMTDTIALRNIVLKIVNSLDDIPF